MRRLYIVPKSVWFAGAHAGLFHPSVGSHYLDVATGSAVTTHADLIQRFASAGHDLSQIPSARGAFAQEDGGGTSLILMSTDFAAEGTEDIWHSHASVAILPHPAYEGNDPLTKHIGPSPKHLHQYHLDALAGHPTLGYAAGDTVHDLARKAIKLHPQLKLRHLI